MGQGVSTVVSFAVGVAISPVPIIAVILMLFSQRARVNGSLFAAAWAATLALVSGIGYVLGTEADAATSETTTDAIAWGKIVFGVLFLLLAGRSWRSRPAPGSAAQMPTWMAGIDAFTPGKAIGLAVLLGGVNPKNLMLALAAGTALAGLGLPTGEAVWSLIVFVVVGTLSIGLPVVYYLVGGDAAKARLDDLKGWLSVHNDAVMAVLFLVLGVDLIAKGLPPLT
jgi:Sap, sulfolipid-1-addressing protein